MAESIEIKMARASIPYVLQINKFLTELQINCELVEKHIDKIFEEGRECTRLLGNKICIVMPSFSAKDTYYWVCRDKAIYIVTGRYNGGNIDCYNLIDTYMEHVGRANITVNILVQGNNVYAMTKVFPGCDMPKPHNVFFSSDDDNVIQRTGQPVKRNKDNWER